MSEEDKLRKRLREIELEKDREAERYRTRVITQAEVKTNRINYIEKVKRELTKAGHDKAGGDWPYHEVRDWIDDRFDGVLEFEERETYRAGICGADGTALTDPSYNRIRELRERILQKAEGVEVEKRRRVYEKYNTPEHHRHVREVNDRLAASRAEVHRHSGRTTAQQREWERGD